MKHEVFPFSAIVGQDRLKLALLLAAVNPRVGGVLIRGEKGTAKSTTVRALADLLPGTRVVTLPLNATEDRVSGGIDFGSAVKSGTRTFQPGLLSRAHKGILYVDEVNLLDDHIVDIILDASASGENRVEREGISFCHDSNFLLVGTMNPEEGELRPQLLDRFGLCVEVRAEADIEKRILLMERKESYDADPKGFLKKFQPDNIMMSEKIIAAQNRLDLVGFSKELRKFTAELCMESHVAGHRADLVLEQAVLALCAFNGSLEAGVNEVKQAAQLVLVHRKRDAAPPPPPDHSHPDDQDPDDHNHDEEKEPEDTPDEHPPEEQEPDHENGMEAPDPGDEPEEQDQEQDQEQEPDEEDHPVPEPEPEEDNREQDKKDVLEKIFEVGETFKVKKFTSPKDRILRRGSGRRSRSRTSAKQGRYVKSSLPKGTHDIAFDATLRAAAPFQVRRKEENTGLAVVLKDRDIREKTREKRIGNFLLFCVDASASMGARGRMAASKGAIMSLLLDAYQKRDKVAMVTFRKDEAFVNLPPTSSVELAGKLLEEMPVGGKTPLSSGLVKTYEMLRNHLLREPESRPMVIVITDGRGNVALGDKKPFAEALELAERMALEDRIQFILVDSEAQGPVSFGLAEKLAARLNAGYFKIQDLKADQLVGIAKGEML